MMLPKFKVGDKVKVLRASTEKEHDLWMDVWVYKMNCVINSICTITYVNTTYSETFDTVYPKYRLDKCPLNFPEFVLQRYSEKGRQLLFPFMTP